MDADEPLGISVQSVVVDAHDPAAQARFWAQALGWKLTFENDEESVLGPPQESPAYGVIPELLFVRVGDGKASKNRLHFDLRPDSQQRQVDRLLELGARRTDIEQTGDERWVVLADPEGNEFCVLAPLPPRRA